MKATELIRLLEKAGWVEVRQSGGHKIFQSPKFQHNVVVPMHRGDLKTGTLHAILKDAGLK